MTAAIAFLCFVQSPTIEIGSVDFFGQTGLDVAKIKAVLPIHAGDRVSFDDWPRMADKVNKAVLSVLGKPPTEVAMVSYDIHGKTMIFLGLPGPTIRVSKHPPAPTGKQRLPEEAAKLYGKMIDRLQPALKAGHLTEDDSKGYAISSDPEMKEAQLKMRDYMLGHEAIVFDVLRNSASVPDRQAASWLAGYANRSKSQIDALASAARDADDGVRNNAVRALGVIASADPAAAKLFPAAQFVDMLCSGTWTDRNKGVFVVSMLTRSRDPKLLALIKDRALASLIEMARWTNPPHAQSSWTILGRVAGIDETKLTAMVEKRQFEEIIRAAGKSG